MSRSKRGSGMDEAVRNHLAGTPFAHNGGTTRTDIIERMYQRLLAELASNRFKWTGLPESVDVRFMETTLFYQGLSVFYFDKDYDKYFALKGASTSFVNMLDNPTGFTVIGYNFNAKQIAAYQPSREYEGDTAKDTCIPIWSNYLRMPDWDVVRIYASRLAELDTTIEINSRNARLNKLIITADNTRLSAINLNRQLEEGGTVQINANGPMSDAGGIIQTLDLNVSTASINELHVLRTRMWNECMGLMGINNSNQDKKERLVAAEVAANDDQTYMMRYVNLNARQMAAKQISEVFGLNVSVDYYIEDPVENPMEDPDGTNPGEVV